MHRAALVICSAAALAAGEAPIANCTVERPAGAYAALRLDFKVDGVPPRYAAWTHLATLRDGVAHIDHGVGVLAPGGTLTLKDGVLSGSFKHQHPNIRKEDPEQEIVVEAKIDGTAINGTCTISGKAGTVRGTLTSAETLAQRNAVRADVAWPNFLGPAGTSAMPTGAVLVASLDGLQPLWRSEDRMPQAPGSHTRKPAAFVKVRTGGGGWSPVAADGLVFGAYYLPTPPAGTELTPGHPLAGKEKFFPTTDDVVVAVDAATGATRWRAVMRDRKGVNVQGHKIRPFNRTPAVAGGRVFAPGSSGFVYAFDAKEGTPLWEARFAAEPKNPDDLALMATRSVVIATIDGKWGAFDAATGAQRWVSSYTARHAVVALWSLAEQESIVFASGRPNEEGELVCLDADTGAERWKRPFRSVSSGRGKGPGGLTIHGDTLIAYHLDPAAVLPGATAGADVKDDGKDDEEKDGKEPLAPHVRCSAWTLTLTGPEPLWQVPEDGGPRNSFREHVPVVVRGTYVCTGGGQVIELKTGRIAGRVDRAQKAFVGNGGYLQAVEDLVLVRNDGTHGHVTYVVWRIAADGTPTVLNDGKEWVTPVGPQTSSYHTPIMYPILDGRLYLRMADGIHCYDLRAPR